MSVQEQTGETIGIVAGAGNVPIEIAEAIEASGKRAYVLAIDPAASPDIARFSHERIAIGQIGRMIRLLRANTNGKIVISGSLSRPDLRTLNVDFGFFWHLRRIIALMRGGDDRVLRLVIRFYEQCGFEVLGIGDVAPGLLAQRGTIVGHAPQPEQRQAAQLGFNIIAQLGAFDIGQAIVLDNQAVHAIEAVEGTDAMLSRLACEQPPDAVNAPVLVKATKPDQELRVDLPTIGARTIEACQKAGIAMVAIEAGRSVIAERARTLSVAAEAGVSIVGLSREPAQRPPLHRSSATLPYKLTCLTKVTPDKTSRTDAQFALRTAPVLLQWGASASLVVSRQQVLAVGVDEPAMAVVARAAGRKQWSDRKRNKRRGLVALSGQSPVDAALISQIAAARFTGLVLDGCPGDDMALAALIRQADRDALFIVVRP